MLLLDKRYLICYELYYFRFETPWKWFGAKWSKLEINWAKFEEFWKCSNRTATSTIPHRDQELFSIRVLIRMPACSFLLWFSRTATWYLSHRDYDQNSHINTHLCLIFWPKLLGGNSRLWTISRGVFSRFQLEIVTLSQGISLVFIYGLLIVNHA